MEQKWAITGLELTVGLKASVTVDILSVTKDVVMGEIHCRKADAGAAFALANATRRLHRRSRVCDF